MPEAMPHQQNVDQDTQYVDGLHDTIANNDLGPGVFNTDPTPGPVEDVDKALEMAHAAKPGVDEVLGVVAMRDHDISPFGMPVYGEDGTFHGHLPATKDGAAHLITKPHRTELVDNKGVKTGRTGVRSEEHSYADLNYRLQRANKAAVQAGEDYDRRQQ